MPAIKKCAWGQTRITNDSEATTSPYVGELSIAGHFTLDEDFPEDKAEQMVHLNAGAILYGAIRELVLTLTSRSIHGELILPTIDARSFLPVKGELESRTVAQSAHPQL